MKLDFKILLLILPVMLFTSSLQANELIRLFKDGQQVSNYDSKLKDLRVNDTLVFDDGKEFKILSDLDPKRIGTTTMILEVNSVAYPAKSFALRIPLLHGKYQNRQTRLNDLTVNYTDFINYYMNGSDALISAGLMPKVHGYLKGQYILVEKLNITYRLDHYLNNLNSYDDKTSNELNLKLDEFARRISYFFEIGDFNFSQVVYANEKWQIIDATEVTLADGEMHSEDLKEFNPFMEEIKNHVDRKALFSTNAEEKAKLFDISTRVKLAFTSERIKMIDTGRNPISKVEVSIKDYPIMSDSDEKKYCKSLLQ